MNALNDIGGEADLRRLFSRFPTGVTALCAMDQDNPVGMTASAFVAVSLNPSLVSVCIKHGSGAWRRLRAQKRIGISFLSHEHAATARQLAQRSDDRFLGIDYEAADSGALFLVNATAWLECTVEREIAVGDHDIVLFRLHGATSADHAMPLVFHSSSFHALPPIEDPQERSEGAREVLS